MQKRLFPLHSTGRMIPWSVAERAYEVYSKRYGTSQSLERLAQRGGFGAEELDDMIPGWREEVEEVFLLRAEVKRLTAENEELSQHVCSECDPENYGWIFNRVEGKAACGCMVEAEPFQILLTALETISKAATGENQIADDDTEGMRWIAGKAMEALHSVLPLDYDAPKATAEAARP